MRIETIVVESIERFVSKVICICTLIQNAN